MSDLLDFRPSLVLIRTAITERCAILAPRAAQPTVAFVGRPNVGKSCLFNRFTGARDALVHEEAGVTRDRLYGFAYWSERSFRVVDTGGIEFDTGDVIKEGILEQADEAIDEADVIIFLVDGKEGCTVLDELVAERLRPHAARVILAVNKVDDIIHSAAVHDFHKLGLDEGIWVSATHGLNVDELLDRTIELLEIECGDEQARKDDRMRVAFVGRPNVGKSSCINRLIRENRLVVTDVAGTTRASVPVPFMAGDEELVLVDTAGIRKKKRGRTGVEKLSIAFAMRAIRMADLVVQVVDVTHGLEHQDRHIAGMIADARRAHVFALNKWDLVEERADERKKMLDEFDRYLALFHHVPKVFLSAKTGRGMNRLMEACSTVAGNCKIQVPTNRLMKMVDEALILHSPPSRVGRQLKIAFATQLRNRVATFVFKVNHPEMVNIAFRRFLTNTFRRSLGLDGVPITLLFREK